MTPAAFSSDEDDSRYRLTSPLEIATILGAIEKRNLLLRMQVAGSTAALVTTIVEVNAKDASFAVDLSPEASGDQRILAADTLVFHTNLDKISVHFTAPRLAAFTHGDHRALRVMFPESVLRIQRREFYRVDAPHMPPSVCTIPLPETPGAPLRLPVKDLSLGGLALLDAQGDLPFSVGQQFDDVQLDLPDSEPITTTLRVVRDDVETLNNGKSLRIIGCAFVKLPPAAEIGVQHFIGRIERQENARRRGFE